MKVIVCGAGQVGQGIAQHLAGEGIDVIVVDRAAALMQRISDTLDVRPIQGHGAYPETLEKAGAADADILIAVTASDEVNMVTCQVAKSLFNVPKTIARVRDRHYLSGKWQDSLFNRENIPVDVIISPETEVGEAVVRRLALPGTFDNFGFCDNVVQMIGVSIENDCPVIDTPLNQLTGLFPDLRAIVVGLERDGHLYVPEFDDTILAGDKAYLVTAASDTLRTLKIFGHEEREARRIVIVGAGNIGYQVARTLENGRAPYSISLIEQEEARAREVAEKLTKSVLLHGDGLSPEILAEAGVCDADITLGLTNDDQVNVLTTLLGLQEGSVRGMCLINDNSFQRLAGKFGMEVAINPRAITVSSILGQVRRGQIIRVHAIGDGGAEALEAEVLEGSVLVGQKLRDLDLPDGIRFGAMVRADELITPRGGTEIKIGDRIVVFALSNAIEDVERLFPASRQKN